jgi:PleD family two-component response regulator
MTLAANADILIVDDTPANLNVLSAILGKRGYRVRPAINGALALKAAQKAAPDLILLDVQMPGLDGYEVCRQLKADAQTRAIPVIFISALDDVLDKVEAFQVGGVDYITKPFQIEEVLARVENQIALHQQREEIAALLARNQQLIALATGEQRPQLDQIADLAAALRDGGDMALAEQIRARADGLRAALDELLGNAGDRQDDKMAK